MSKKIAVCIGVDKVKGFTKLSGASLGAVRFSEWASKNGYEVKVFTDQNENIVRSADIYDYIEASVDSMQCNQIIVYFSGHGISRGPNQEFWLLSKSGTNVNEFVDLRTSFDGASTCPVPYVLFISDACRSLPEAFNQTTGGQSIFPLRSSGSSSIVDIFYATRPGASAFEIAGNGLATSYGIFTESLIDYLNGMYLDTIANYDNNGDSEVKYFLSKYYDPIKLRLNRNYKSLRKPSLNWIISAVEVQIKLKEIVEDRAHDKKLRQSPEFRLNNHLTEFPLTTFTDEEGKDLVLKDHGGIGLSIPPITPVPDNKSPIREIKDFTKSLWPNRSDTNVIKNAINNKLKEKIFVTEQMYSNTDYDLYTGFTVHGEKIQSFALANGRLVKPIDNFIPIGIGETCPIPTSGLLILRNGSSIPVPVIEGFIGELIFKEGYLFTINYTPSRKNNHVYEEFQLKNDIIMKKRNYIAVAANNGFDYNEVFKNVDFESFGQIYDDPGSFLRIGKSLDPSLSLYAAYAFRESGNWGKIKSVYDYIQQDALPVIFDVAMLAGRLYEDKKTAAFCPVMSAGWSYGHLYANHMNDYILKAANYLKPGLWTNFETKGTDIILNKILKR